MKVSYWARVLLQLIAVLGLTAGCASPPIHAVNSFVTDYQSLVYGKRTPKSTFTQADTIRFLVDLQWDDPKKDAGFHDVKWNWYSNGQLISTGGREFHFKHTPYELWGVKQASALGTGDFKVDLLVDGQIMATQTFSITAQ